MAAAISSATAIRTFSSKNRQSVGSESTVDSQHMKCSLQSAVSLVSVRGLNLQTCKLSSQKSLPCGHTIASKGNVLCAAADGDSLGDSPSDGNVTEIHSKEDFNKLSLEAGDKLLVVDVSTRTCGPCKFIYPKIVQMSLDHPDVVFLKIMGDKDEHTRALMREWGVRAVPHFRFYRNGDLIMSHNGAKEEVLRANFESCYAKVTA